MVEYLSIWSKSLCETLEFQVMVYVIFLQVDPRNERLSIPDVKYVCEFNQGHKIYT